MVLRAPDAMESTYVELLEKMQVMSRQLNKLTKQVTANPTRESSGGPSIPFSIAEHGGSISSPARTSVDLSQLPPTTAGGGGVASPYRTARTNSMDGATAATTQAANTAMAVASSDGGALLTVMTSLQDNVTRVANRLEKMEAKFSKSHKFLRHRVREQMALAKKRPRTISEDGALDASPSGTALFYTSPLPSKATAKANEAAAAAKARPLSAKTQQLLAVIGQQRHSQQHEHDGNVPPATSVGPAKSANQDPSSGSGSDKSSPATDKASNAKVPTLPVPSSPSPYTAPVSTAAAGGPKPATAAAAAAKTTTGNGGNKTNAASAATKKTRSSSEASAADDSGDEDGDDGDSSEYVTDDDDDDDDDDDGEDSSSGSGTEDDDDNKTNGSTHDGVSKPSKPVRAAPVKTPMTATSIGIKARPQSAAPTSSSAAPTAHQRPQSAVPKLTTTTLANASDPHKAQPMPGPSQDLIQKWG